MIRHFLRRDFLDFRLGWIIVAIITGLGLGTFAVSAHTASLAGLFYAYFIFALLPIGHIQGSLWRTQHQMSRHYLLSLPVSHKRLFVVQQIRLVVFWLPLATLAALAPFLTGVGQRWSGTGIWLLFYFALLTTISFFMHTMTWQGLEMERISSYVPKGRRVWITIRHIGVFVTGYAVLGFAWQDLLDTGTFFPFMRTVYRTNHLLASLVFPAVFIVLTLWIPRTARRWYVTP